MANQLESALHDLQHFIGVMVCFRRYWQSSLFTFSGEFCSTFPEMLEHLLELPDGIRVGGADTVFAEPSTLPKSAVMQILAPNNKKHIIDHGCLGM